MPFELTTTTSIDQGQALDQLVSTIAEAGDVARAETLARTLTAPKDKVQALASLATAGRPGWVTWAAPIGMAADAEALARTITDPYVQGPGARRRWPTATAQAGDLDRAEALARTITDPLSKDPALDAGGRSGRPGPRRQPRQPAGWGPGGDWAH